MKGIEDRLRRIRDSLTVGLVERDVAVRLALIAALSGEHLLLVGPPGTAKSLVARRLRLAFTDTSYFERLLTRFSVPEELFGPLSIKRLQEDRYERLTKSYLPTASIAFLDEIFKANSAILNALLTLLNEREFDNGDRRESTPLTAVVAASNELPEGEELSALFDRFLVRLHVVPLSRAGFSKLLRLKGSAEPDVSRDLRLTDCELTALQERSEDVRVPEDVLALLRDLREWCIAETIPVSDRRWHKVVKLLQTSALTNGRHTVSIWDCWLLQHCLWSETEDRERIFNWYALRVGAATDEPSRLLCVVNIWEGQFKKDKEDQSQLRDDKGNLLYMGDDGKLTSSKKGQRYSEDVPLFAAPEQAWSGDYHGSLSEVDRTNKGKGYTGEQLDQMIIVMGRSQHQFSDWPEKDAHLSDKNNWIMIDLEPAIGPTKHKNAYVEKCLQQVREVRESAIVHKKGIEGQIESFERDIRSHLWVTEDFVKPASQGLLQRLDEAKKLLDRLAAVETGYESLPREEEDPQLVIRDDDGGVPPKGAQ